MNELLRRNDWSLINLVFDLSLNYLDHPLNSVAAIAKGLLKKILAVANGD